MKLTRRFRNPLLAGVILAITTVVFGEFTKLVSITGGSAQRLSTSLTSAGYSGSTALDELTVCVPDANTNTMYLGSQSNVNASTGFALAPGTCITYQAAGRPIDSSTMYVYTATTESIAVTLRPR